jgi:hypothetical protein
MNISTSEAYSIFKTGSYAMVFASLYSVFDLYTRKTIGQPLSIPTEAIQYQDNRIHLLLLQLEERCNILDRSKFMQVVNSIDRLLFLEKQLFEGVVSPLFQDRIAIFCYFDKVNRTIQTILPLVESTYPPRLVVTIQKQFQTLLRYLEQHMTSVFNFTNNM